MATTVEEIESDIRTAIKANYRGELLNRGEARSLIWSEGELPPDAPEYSPDLSYDLLSYAYSLFNLSIRLKELEGDVDLYKEGFSKAGVALETTIHNSSRDTAFREFHGVLAGCAYHLGGYSAKAFSLLQKEVTGGKISKIEKTLVLLIFRNFSKIEEEVLEWKASSNSQDHILANQINDYFDESEYSELHHNGDFEIDIILSALTDNYFSAIRCFIFSLESGNVEIFNHAIALLKNGFSVSTEFQFVPQWWIHKVTIHLIEGLWQSSFHSLLPSSLPDDDEEWSLLRSIFITSLYSRKKSEVELWPSQLEGARRSIDVDDNLVVSLPTSAGKTRIAELCILRCLATKQRILFITPLRALSAQTEIGLRQTFTPLGAKVSTLYGSIGASNFERDAIRNNNIVVGTPEKLDFALRSDPTLLDDIGLIILDEGHMIGLSEREIRYEVQIQRLLKRSDSHQRRIVCLSAILPDNDQLEDFVGWLRNGTEGEAVKCEWRPTDLKFGDVIWKESTLSARLQFRIGDDSPFVPNFLEGFVPPVGQRRKIFPKNGQELSLATAWKLVEEGHSVLIYCPQKRSINPLAKAVIDLNKRGALPSLLSASLESLQAAKTLGKEWLGGEHPILKCLELGVGVHHGSLPTPFRKEIERLLRERILKVTISSPTLAQGLNLSATTIIMHSLQDFSGDVIKTPEFKNVIGRAGRAFIDTHGLVLHPIYDDHANRRRKWKKLIADTSSREMESGLFRLVMALILRIAKHLKTKESGDVMEYILNTAFVWDFPCSAGENENIKESAEQNWANHISYLDTALMSILGQQDVDINNVAEVLDEFLQDSLWQRRISRQDDAIVELLSSSLESRAKYILNNSTAPQRAGYFLAGVGLDSGKKLDEVAVRANQLLVVANTNITSEDFDDAVKNIIELAEIIFDIPPFTPYDLPDDWRTILDSWLRGKPIVEPDDEVDAVVLKFIEESLVYRLPWGLEAIRVRAEANGDLITEEFTIDDFDIDVLVPSIENGTMNRSASLLMQAGFQCRLAAIKAVTDGGGSFTNKSQLLRWLKSYAVVELFNGGDWPTSDTANLWEEFVSNIKPYEENKWELSETNVSVIWTEENHTPESGYNVKICNLNNTQTSILNWEGEIIGHLSEKLNLAGKGTYQVAISLNTATVDIAYLGSASNPF